MNNPLVSIIMPTYNCEKYVEEAIQSVINQTMEDWELIVIDDASSDDTYSIIKEFNDSRIHIYKNEENLGVAKTRNKGMDLSKGKYIAFLDSDDIWLETKLEKQLELAKETNADLIYCSYMILYQDGSEKPFIVPHSADFNYMLACSVASCSTSLLTRKLADEYRFETNLYHEDLALWLKIVFDGYQARGCTEILAKYRMVPNSRSSQKLKSALNRWKVFRNYFHLSAWKSTYYFMKYAFLGLKKYVRVG
ncbi:MAG: glycosyltransferase family 2 protein [Erysipelotrichaceae bacterium]|uniref:glycosyltransferase family 2 protein n=1 Tax=Floccifex sp. TaxID=2815810 RepID=UPI002A7609EC|nr:glycosyltransferase family 2 protein [Floccifex sp.]MDD7280683.1 glycosyltransferase family 2 protein [Erysipelotrichaceae bacterium]MDY2957676.1 glycosyltransferase family 2 protein [Floccifex sp.]